MSHTHLKCNGELFFGHPMPLESASYVEADEVTDHVDPNIEDNSWKRG